MKTLFGKAIFVCLNLFISLTINRIFAQDYPLAPEVWSEPVRIFPDSGEFIARYEPSLTKNLDTMYFHKSGEIYRSVKINNVWQTEERLSDNVNDGTPSRNPSISKNGKRIYYSAWGGYGGWDLWYNDWVDSLNDWDQAKNMGPVINSSTSEMYLYEESRDTIYTINSHWTIDGPAKYVWNDSLQNWSLVDSFYYHYDLGIGELHGLSITKNKRKMYYGLRPWDNDILEKQGMEICVTYWDSTINNWGNSFYLNLNSKPHIDSSTNAEFRGTEYSPWISEDGKVIIFESDRDSLWNGKYVPSLYISYLLVDENGDTVPSVLQEENPRSPNELGVQQNYPNPFNSSSIIPYIVPASLKSDCNIKLTVFDIRGREVTVLVNSFKKPGYYEALFDASKYGLSSGIYIYHIKIGGFTQAQKMIYLQ